MPLQCAEKINAARSGMVRAAAASGRDEAVSEDGQAMRTVTPHRKHILRADVRIMVEPVRSIASACGRRHPVEKRIAARPNP
jgi:hypothetical protein